MNFLNNHSLTPRIPPTVKGGQKSRLPLFITLIIIIFGFYSYYSFPQFGDFTQSSLKVLGSNNKEEIKIWISSFSWRGPLLLIVAMILQMFLLVVPSTLILVVCVLAYGPLWGSLIALLAIYAASSIGYLLGWFFGDQVVERLLGNQAKNKVTGFLENHGLWAIFLTRLNPFLSNDAVSLVSGILRIEYWKFTLASLSGIAPLILCIALFGESREGMVCLLAGSLILLVLYCGYVFLWEKKNS